LNDKRNIAEIRLAWASEIELILLVRLLNTALDALSPCGHWFWFRLDKL
jgi:hypothetical protein